MVVFARYPADPRVRREAEKLNRSGIAVDVICLRGPVEPSVEEFGGTTAYRVMRSTEKNESVWKYFWLSALFAVYAFIKLQRLSLRERYSLVQAHNMPDFLIFIGVVHKILGRPLVLDLHDLIPELLESKYGVGKNAVLGLLVRLMERMACGFADHLITTSLGFRYRLIAKGVAPDKLTVVLNTADDDIFKIRSQRSWPRISRDARLLYHGTIARRFGLHIAIEAVHKVQTTIPGTRLYIYGEYDSEYHTELERLVFRLGMEEHVLMRGFVPEEQIVRIIEDSDIGVVPYLSDPFMDLALTTEAFEYISMGLPVVASRLRSLNALLDQPSIHYVAPGDAFDLANKIELLCCNPELRREYADRAGRAYAEISWSIMADRYLNLIDRLITKMAQKFIQLNDTPGARSF